MVNKTLLEEGLTKKFANQFFHMIVHESFMCALPVDKSTITRDEKTNLHFYTKNIVESIGGYKAIESAIDIQHKTPAQNMFLAEMYNICMESAKECAKKKCADPDICGKDDKLPDIVKKATLSKEDCIKFAKKANNMNLDDVADIIKKKTLDVISDEKKQYEKEKELDDELQNALSENDTMDDLGEDNIGDDLESDDGLADDLNPDDPSAEESSTDLTHDEKGKQNASLKGSKNGTSANGPSKPAKVTESFKNSHLERMMPRHHISIFSRLQETAMEMMTVINTPNYGRDYFPILEATTFGSLLSKPSNVLKPANEASTIAKEEICEVPSQTRPKIATLVSIITYTIMETLHTMGIFTPTNNSIRKFVDTTTDTRAFQKKSVDESCDAIRCAVKESAMLDFSKMSSNRLGNKLATLKSALESTQEIIDTQGATTEMINLASEAVNHINRIENIMNQRIKDHQALSEANESMQTKIEKENDVAQFNRIAGMFKSNPQVSEIRLVVNPNHMQSIIDIECANESGQVIRKSFMNMEYACESDQYLKYLDSAYKKSKLPNINKEVYIKLLDGKGTKIKM